MKKDHMGRYVAASAVFALIIGAVVYLGGHAVVAVGLPGVAGDPQFRIEITGSDKAGFDIDYSYPESEPKECTVKVEVTYSATSDKSPDKFEFTHKVHNTGTGWAYFDGKAALDKFALKDVRITSKSCS